MRKILLSVLIVLTLIGVGFTITNGFKLGSFQIWGIKEIIAKNKNIDSKNEALSTLVSVTYPTTLEELNKNSETLISTKQEYENKAVLVSNSKYYMQTEKYEIEFLWIRLGNHAKNNNVQIKIDVVNSSASGLYDLKFTIAGRYSDVTDFIYDIENDSKLGFKIEDFHMSANGDGVQGIFNCKEISINIETLDEENTDSEENTTQNGTNTDNENTSVTSEKAITNTTTDNETASKADTEN